MTRTVFFACLVLLTLTNSSCMTAAKRVLREAQGATSKTRTFPGSSRNRYKTFQAVSAAPATSEVAPLVSEEFMKSLRIELVNQLVAGEKPLFRKEGEPMLTIESRVMWYHKPGAFGDILGNYSYTVVVYTLTGNGQLLDQVQIVTKSAASRTDDVDMAKSSAAELVKWFADRRKGTFEEDEEKKREEEERRRRDDD